MSCSDVVLVLYYDRYVKSVYRYRLYCVGWIVVNFIP